MIRAYFKSAGRRLDCSRTALLPSREISGNGLSCSESLPAGPGPWNGFPYAQKARRATKTVPRASLAPCESPGWARGGTSKVAQPAGRRATVVGRGPSATSRTSRFPPRVTGRTVSFPMRGGSGLSGLSGFNDCLWGSSCLGVTEVHRSPKPANMPDHANLIGQFQGHLAWNG
jgi:hypothetical protein